MDIQKVLIKVNISIYFLVKDNELLMKYNDIFYKVSNSIKKDLIGNQLSNFHDDGMSKEDSHFIYLSVILTDSAFKIGKNYYLKCF